MQQRRALGRGLDSLIPTNTSAVLPQVGQVAGSSSPVAVSPNMISPNRQQPRTVFNEDGIRELADSIKKRGIIQPLLVTQLSGGRYELIAGERRLRAARMLGLESVPVIVRESLNQEEMLALALIENVQREDLNPIEEAMAFQDLVEQHDYSQEDIAKEVGKSRVHVANSLRLLKLPKVVQDDLIAGKYTAGHARAILGLSNIHDQLKLREYILKQIPTVRDVERFVQSRVGGGDVRRTKKSPGGTVSPQIAMIREEITQALGTKVKVSVSPSGTGQLTVDFYSLEDLDRIYRRIVS